MGSDSIWWKMAHEDTKASGTENICGSIPKSHCIMNDFPSTLTLNKEKSIETLEEVREVETIITSNDEHLDDS